MYFIAPDVFDPNRETSSGKYSSALASWYLASAIPQTFVFISSSATTSKGVLTGQIRPRFLINMLVCLVLTFSVFYFLLYVLTSTLVFFQTFVIYELVCHSLRFLHDRTTFQIQGFVSHAPIFAEFPILVLFFNKDFVLFYCQICLSRSELRWSFWRFFNFNLLYLFLHDHFYFKYDTCCLVFILTDFLVFVSALLFLLLLILSIAFLIAVQLVTAIL